MQNARLINFTALLLALYLVGYILYIGSHILLPFIVAVVVWYIIIAIAELIKKIPLFKIKIPSFLAILIALALTYIVLHFIIVLITNSVIDLVNGAPKYQEKLSALIQYLNQEFDLNYNINTILAKVNLSSVFTNVTLALTNLAQNFFVIIIYVLFLLLEYQTFSYKLKGMLRSENNYNKAKLMIHSIKNKINAYIRLKTLISLLTAFLSYLVLIAFKIQNPLFWALLIFLLNYIPTIGSIVAVGFTLLVVSIEFSSLSMFGAFAVTLIAVQFIVGNIIEPKFTGSGLNLSPIVILLSLAFWGSIWGIIGMFLCVPLMTIVNIVLLNFEKTRPLAILLAAKYEATA